MPKSANNIVQNSASNFRVWSLSLLSICVIIFSVTVFYVTQTQNNYKNASLTVSLKSDSKELKVGKSAIVNLYFSGINSAKVLSTDIKLAYDAKLVKVTKAEAGPYFKQPFQVKWSIPDNKFTLVSNPGVPQTPDPMLSVIKFEITPLKETEKLEIVVDPSTIAYIEKKGEANLEINPAVFTVKK